MGLISRVSSRTYRVEYIILTNISLHKQKIKLNKKIKTNMPKKPIIYGTENIAELIPKADPPKIKAPKYTSQFNNKVKTDIKNFRPQQSSTKQTHRFFKKISPRTARHQKILS